MELAPFGCQSIHIPTDWTADEEIGSALMRMRSFHPIAHNDVEITFFKKMQGADQESVKDFRELLNQPVHKIVEGETELLKLTPVLGNAGNNQWSNKERGAAGPNFRFTSAETRNVQGRPLLQMKGSFIEPETKKAITEYCGLFIDTGADRNPIQEIYLQVPSKYGYFQFEQYLKVFLAAVSSIVWE
jgi:hypothetical protein